MPIYHKTTPPSSGGNHNTAEIDYHTSEAAKVKRTREQAYFNSYDFDAIEVLPYDDEEDENDKRQTVTSKRERERRQMKTKQQPQQTSNHCFKVGSSSSCSFMVDNRQHYPLHHHVNSKHNPSMYLQRISAIFSSKANNSNNKPHLQQQQQQQQHHQLHNPRNSNNDIVLAVNTPLSHDNKHLKMSSSETSSTSLSSSSIVEEILNVDNNAVDVGIGAAGISSVGGGNATGSGGLLPLKCTRDVIATVLRAAATTSEPTTLNGKIGSMASTTPATTVAAVAGVAAAANSTTTTGNGGNFLLPRAMLKYQSSTLNTQPGASGTQTTSTNSMPLATNVSSNNSNISSPTNISTHIILSADRAVHKLDGIKSKNAMMPTSGTNAGLKLKKTSTSSSVITSLASEDIEENRDLENNKTDLTGKVKTEAKVSPKTINPKTSARAPSHQSHYSTDKSASSGYYSSNVCSTYSLEEHIYSEPTLDLKKLRNNAKDSKASVAVVTPSSAATLQTNHKLQQHQHVNNLLPPSTEANSAMRSLDNNRRYRFAESPTNSNRNSQEFNENLKILESSIENLDRHLKSFPGANSQEALVSYTQNPYYAYASVNNNDKLRPSSSYHQLPTIQEYFDGGKKPTWPEDRSDDSLMDIDLDSFLLNKDQKLCGKTKKALTVKGGVDNPTFLTEEQEENHYKCAKYINSCPEDAYRVESDIIAPARSSISSQSVAVSVDLYPKRYEEQLHFQNTRELLEDVRDKIRLLTKTQENDKQPLSNSPEDDKGDEVIPKELHSMINTLKQELELYLDRMNQHSELEIRQLCTGLVKNQHIVKMKNAFERRRSLTEFPDIYSTYEAIKDGIVMNNQGVPISIRQQITSIRCSSDPNFKMKRKSITEVFPMAECYVESLKTDLSTAYTEATQLQRNLSYHKPVLEPLKTSSSTNSNLKQNNPSSGTASGGDSSEPTDKESILDWHRKKPSIWELYYGTNRIQQSLLGSKKNGMMVTTALASSPSTMCYMVVALAYFTFYTVFL